MSKQKAALYVRRSGVGEDFVVTDNRAKISYFETNESVSEFKLSDADFQVDAFFVYHTISNTSIAHGVGGAVAVFVNLGQNREGKTIADARVSVVEQEVQYWLNRVQDLSVDSKVVRELHSLSADLLERVGSRKSIIDMIHQNEPEGLSIIGG